MREVVDIPATVARLKALANPARLRIALHLLDGEKGVGEIETDLALKQPNLSQYLAELREAGLVKTRREARNVFYAVADGPAEALLRSLTGDVRPPSPGSVSRRAGPPLAAAAFAIVTPRR